MLSEGNGALVPARRVGLIARPAPLTLTAGERWFAVKTLAKRENVAALSLEYKGFRVFRGEILAHCAPRPKEAECICAAVPGVRFRHPQSDQGSMEKREQRGRRRFAGYGTELPIPVPHGVVEALIERGDSLKSTRSGHALEIGQKVRILSGPFAETLCQLDYLEERGRVRVLLEIMGGKVTAHLDRSTVAPVE